MNAYMKQNLNRQTVRTVSEFNKVTSLHIHVVLLCMSVSTNNKQIPVEIKLK